jgi:integrase
MPTYKRKLSKGERWWYKFVYQGQTIFSQAIYPTKKEATMAEAERLRQAEEDYRNPKKDIRLLDLCNDRLDYIKIKKSKDYYKENARYFRKFIEEIGNDTSVIGITRKQINALFMKEANRLKKAGKSNHKLNAMIRCLKALFNYGIRYHDLNMKNPVAYIELYPLEVSLKYIPSDETIELVRDKLSDGQRILFDFVDQTACRVMEAVNLKWSDKDNGLITVYTRKSKNSNLTPRRLPLPECLKDITGKGKVFKDWNAYPRFLEETLKALGLKPFGWHNLRHRRASMWARDGMTTFEIMARLGHNNLGTTMRYLQLLGFTRM